MTISGPEGQPATAAAPAAAARAAVQPSGPSSLTPDDLPQATISIDDRGLIVDWSDQAEHLFGWSAAEVMGRSLATTIVPPFYREAHVRGVQRFRPLGGGRLAGRIVELRALRRDGSEFPVQMLVTHAAGPDGRTVFTAVLRDLSRVRRAAQLNDMQVTVGRALMNGSTVDSALSGVLEAVASTLRCEVAMLWLADPLLGEVRLSRTWSPGVPVLCRLAEEAGATPMPQLEVIRRVWQRGLPFVVRSHTAHANHLLSLGERAGLSWMGAFPLVRADPEGGALVLMASAAVGIDEHLLAAMGGVGSQVGQALARSQAENALRESERQYRSLFQSTPDPILVIDAGSRCLLAANDAAIAKYGYTAAELLAMRLDDIHVAGTADDLDDLIVPTGHPEGSSRSLGPYRQRLKDGRVIDVSLTARAEHFGGRQALLLLVHDITDQLTLQRDLWRQAFHDPLTGLANRALFLDRLGHAISRAGRRGSHCAVLLLDLDDFKSVNDSLGHQTGDELLRAAAGRLGAAVRPSDTVARLGGDEFAILLEDVIDADAEVSGSRVLAALREPLRAGDRDFVVRASLGIATCADPTVPAAEVLRNADLAMYVAKAAGKSCQQVFAPGMHTAMLERVTFEQELRQAIAGGQLTLLYQPIVDIPSGRIVRAEALVRWNHPTRGLLLPDAFIPMAEEMGFIHELGAWVLETACARAREWAGPADAPVIAVNLSGREVTSDGLARRVRAALDASGLPAERLELEITETAAIDSTVLAQLEELRAIGVRVAIDDFGTGYSMLQRLQLFPVDTVKIDKSFIDGIGLAVDAAPLVGAMITLGHSLGLGVVAEGVENPEQLAFLRRHGCDLAQGYLVSRPVAPAAFAELLRRSAAGEDLVEPQEVEIDPVAAVADLVETEPVVGRVIDALLARLQRLTGLECTYVVTAAAAPGMQPVACPIYATGWTGDPGRLPAHADVPLALPGGRLLGSLHGATSAQPPISPGILDLMTLFSRIIAVQLDRYATAG